MLATKYFHARKTLFLSGSLGLYGAYWRPFHHFFRVNVCSDLLMYPCLALVYTARNPVVVHVT